MSAVLLEAPGCHLCHVLAAVAEPVLASFGLALEHRDVHADPETARLYRNEIPVLLVDGTVVARHRADAEDLRARISALGYRPLA
jgi:hypothetical protein